MVRFPRLWIFGIMFLAAPGPVSAVGEQMRAAGTNLVTVGVPAATATVDTAPARAGTHGDRLHEAGELDTLILRPHATTTPVREAVTSDFPLSARPRDPQTLSRFFVCWRYSWGVHADLVRRRPVRGFMAWARPGVFQILVRAGQGGRDGEGVGVMGSGGSSGVGLALLATVGGRRMATRRDRSTWAHRMAVSLPRSAIESAPVIPGTVCLLSSGGILPCPRTPCPSASR